MATEREVLLLVFGPAIEQQPANPASPRTPSATAAAATAAEFAPNAHVSIPTVRQLLARQFQSVCRPL